MIDVTELKQLLDSIRPDVLGWMESKIAEAVITGVAIRSNIDGTIIYPAGIVLNNVFTDTSGSIFPCNVEVETNPSGTSSATFIGIRSTAKTRADNANNITGSIRGMQANALHYSNAGTLTLAVGIRANAGNNGTGTITTAQAVSAYVSNAAGVLTNARPINVLTELAGAGNIPSAVGVTIDHVRSGAGAFTNISGIEIDNVDLATNYAYVVLGQIGTPSGQYGIYNVAADPNYFAGNILIGTSTNPGSLAKGIVLSNGTAVGASVTDGVALWSADVAAGDARLYARYESMGGGSPIALIGLAQTWSAKQTYEEPQEWQEESTPGNPASGYRRPYFKSDGRLYKLNSSGAEADILDISGLTEDTSPQTSDFVATWDGSASAHKKVQLANLPGGAGGNAIPVIKTTDETVTSSTTLQNDDDFAYAIGANENWTATYTLYLTSSAAGGVRLAVTVPSGASCLITGIAVPSGFSMAPVIVTSATTFYNSTPATDWMFHLTITVRNGANSGNVNLQFAQSVSDGTATAMKAGSQMLALEDT